MPSAYCLIESPTSILIAKKRDKMRWYKRRINSPALKIKNNPNQFVLPGGGIEENESHCLAARREFKEETGLTILNKEISNLNPNIIVTIQQQKLIRFTGFSCLHISIKTDEDLNNIVKSINENIRQDNNMFNTSKGIMKGEFIILDDELQEVSAYTADLALREFTNQLNNSDWFVKAVSTLVKPPVYL